MKIEVRYYTRSGNTKKVAEAIADAVHVKAQDISVPLAEKADILFLGCSYYAFDIDDAVKSFVRENKDMIGRIVCFGTSAMLKSVYKPLSKVAAENGVALDKDFYHCYGSFGPMHKGHPNEADLAHAAEFARKVIG